MPRRKILFALSSLKCGGIEKSALALLSKLVADGDDVTLALCNKVGDFLPFVPQEVKIVEIPYGRDVRYEMMYGRKKLLLRYLLHGRMFKALELMRFWMSISKRNADQRAIAISERYCRSLPASKERYDVAYCFSEFTELVYVSGYVKADRKAVWLHTEQGHGFSNVREYAEYLGKMDDIYCVSDALLESTAKALPTLASRIRRYHHIVDFNAIRTMGDAYQADWPVDEGVLRILSVGRLAYQKGFDIAVKVARKLKDRGLRFSWAILGEGNERTALQKLINQLNVSDCVVLMGVRTNPYPFFRACDIYVQPSRYEGYCLTVAEARAFDKPIVATDFNGAREQLTGNPKYKIVDIGEDSILQGVLMLTGIEMP